MPIWSDGYEALWSVREVNRRTWADGQAFVGALSVSISRNCDDDVPLMESATMELDREWPGGERWLRIYLEARDGGGAERHALATMLFGCEAEDRAHGSTVCSLNGRSALKPCDDARLERGTYAPAGCDGAEFAAKLIAQCTPAPVHIEGSFTVAEHVVFDLGATYLEAAWALLDAGGYCIQLDGRGEVHVMPLPSSPSLVLDRSAAGMLLDGSRRSLDISAVPNRYIAVSDEETAVAVNEDDEGSETSYAARGRWVDVVDASPLRIGGETLTAYARRRLAEERKKAVKVRYTREFSPGVHPFGIVRGCFPALGIEGDMRVISQDLSCGAGVTVDEVIGLEVTV